MKKKQDIRHMFGLGVLGMIALLIFIVPAQSFSAEYSCDRVLNENGCPPDLFDINAVPTAGGTIDDTHDTDKDGFRNWFECCVTRGGAGGGWSPTYYNETRIPNTEDTPSGENQTVLDPNIPDVFIVLTADDDAVTVDDPLKFLREGLDINLHVIDYGQVGQYSNPDEYRRVSPSSKQKALFLHLSSEITYGFPDNCPIPAEIKIGEGNIGTTMSNNAGGTIWSNQIEAKVKCLYLEAGYDFDLTPPVGDEEVWAEQQAKMEKEIVDYIRHTIAHEAGHNLSQRFLEVDTDTKDYKQWQKYEYHYKEGLYTIMSQYVSGTVRPGKVILNIGDTFEPDDQETALWNISTDIVGGSPF